MLFCWVSLGSGLMIRFQAPDARQRKPAHFDYAIGPPMCRTRAEEHVTSKNSAVSASKERAENRESAGRAGCGVVGRPGLEPGTYGLKVDRYYAEPYSIVSQCISPSANAIAKNVQECHSVLCRFRCRRASNEQPWGGWHPLTISIWRLLSVAMRPRPDTGMRPSPHARGVRRRMGQVAGGRGTTPERGPEVGRTGARQHVLPAHAVMVPVAAQPRPSGIASLSSRTDERQDSSQRSGCYL
jgi:hypothetical protein